MADGTSILHVLSLLSWALPLVVQEQALTLLRLFEEDVAQHGIAAPELVSGRSKASPQTFQPHQQQQQQGEDAPAVQMESVEQAGTAALPLPPCTARVDAEAPVAEAAEKGRHGSSSPGGSPRLSSSGCGGDVSRSAWSTEVSGVTSWSPVWGGEQEQEEDEELRRGELDTMEGILQLSAGPEGGALASLKGVGGEVVACLEVYSEGKGHVKRPRSKGKSQKKRSFGAVSKSEEAEDGTSSEAEEASLPLSTLLAHRTAPRPEAKAAGAPAAVKAEPGVEMRKKPKKQAAPSHPAGVAAPLGTTAAADVPPGVVALEGSPQELAALEVLSGLLCSSEAPDEGSAHRGGARAAGMKTTTLAARAAAASCLKACSATGFNGPSGVPAVNFGDGAAASVLASLASLSREGSLTQESADSVLDVLEKKPLVQSLSSHPSLVHKVLRKPCPALPGLLLVSECGVACHGPSSARSTSSSVSARGKGAAGKRARGGGFLAPPGLGSSSCSCAQGGMDGLCSLSPARTPSVVTSGWVAAAGPPRRVRSTTPADHPILAGHGAKGPHSPGLRSARTHLCAESISSSRRSMPAVPGCTAPVPRPMEPLDSPDHNHGLHPREVSPELCSGALGVVCQGLARGLPSSASSGDDWGLMTQADLHTLLARGLGRKQDGVHAPSSGADLPGNSTTPVGDSDGPVGLDAWQSQSVDLGAGLTPQPSAGAVSLQQLAAGEEVQDGQCAARTRGYWWDRATRPRRAASVASEGAAAAAAAGSRFPDAVLCSKSKGFVTSPGLARVSLGALASGSPLPNAGILPEALSAAAASPGMWEPPPFQLAEGSTQKDLAPVGVPKAGFGEIPKETGCARTNKPFCWAAHMLKNKKRMSAAGPFSGFYGAPMGVPVDCEAEAAAAAAAVLGLRGSSVEDSFGCISAPAGSSGFASAQLKGGAPPASSLLHSIPPLLPLSNAQSASHAQLSRVLAPQSSSAGSADVPATPLLSGVRIPSEGQRLGGKLQASGTPHLWASWGDGAPTKVVGSRKPPISTFGAGHPGAPAVAAGLASDGGLKTSAPCNVSTGSLTTIV